jgi:hypothetical protein
MGRYLRSAVARFTVLGTLTYPATDEWREAKQHFRRFAARLRRKFRDDPDFTCFWFLEFQANERPHFHFFANRRIGRDWLSTAWAECVDSESFSRHLAAGTRIERLKRGKSGAVSYAKKYARKQEQKKLPPLLENQGFGRWWGIIGDRRTVCASTAWRSNETGNPAIRGKIETLQNELARLISAERVRVLGDGCCYAYWCCDDDAEGLLRAAVLALDAEIMRCRSSADTNRTGAAHGFSR